MKQATILRKDLPALVAQLCKRGARPLSIVIRSDKALLKKDRKTGATHALGGFVTKVGRYSAFLNFDYESSVNKERGREGKEADFKVGQGRAVWFKHHEGDPRPIVRHKDDDSQIYLQVKVEKGLGSTYLLSDGTVKTEAELESLLPVKKKNTNQGVDRPVIPMVPSLENILSLTVDGVEYEVRS